MKDTFYLTNLSVQELKELSGKAINDHQNATLSYKLDSVAKAKEYFESINYNGPVFIPELTFKEYSLLDELTDKYSVIPDVIHSISQSQDLFRVYILESFNYFEESNIDYYDIADAIFSNKDYSFLAISSGKQSNKIYKKAKKYIKCFSKQIFSYETRHKQIKRHILFVGQLTKLINSIKESEDG